MKTIDIPTATLATLLGESVNSVSYFCNRDSKFNDDVFLIDTSGANYNPSSEVLANYFIQDAFKRVWVLVPEQWYPHSVKCIVYKMDDLNSKDNPYSNTSDITKIEAVVKAYEWVLNEISKGIKNEKNI